MSQETSLPFADRVALETARVVCSAFLGLGILAALHTALDKTTTLVALTTSPGTAVTWLLIGLVGAPMAYRVRRARLFLTVTGLFLALWALAGIVLDGAGSDMFVRDRNLILLNVIGALVCLAVASVSAVKRRTTTDRLPANTP